MYIEPFNMMFVRFAILWSTDTIVFLAMYYDVICRIMAPNEVSLLIHEIGDIIHGKKLICLWN